MKNIYSFILGHSPELSLGEIKSVLNYQNISFSIVHSDSKFLLLETEEELDVENLNNTLGGIIKIGKLEFFIDKLDNSENLISSFVEIIKRNCSLDKKVKFGFSLYGKNRNTENFIYKLSIGIKKYFKSEEISSRIVTSKNIELSAVIVSKEHLIDLGFDMQVLNMAGRFYFLRTLAVQDFARFNALDYDRPRVDSKSGMMPPKLAKIMLNLVNKKEIVLDPFCGSGTILLMAAELGFKKVIGSDISEKAILDSQENIKWYQERFNNKIDSYIFKADVINLMQEGIEKNSIDSIVSEGYLGQPLRGNESFIFIQKQISELKELYLNSFKVFKDILKTSGCVIITLPIFVVDNEEKHLGIIREIENLGFKEEFLLEDGKSLIYKREGQRVYRNVIKFIKI
jgi:tRNA G10  N-methylase Trm11